MKLFFYDNIAVYFAPHRAICGQNIAIDQPGFAHDETFIDLDLPIDDPFEPDVFCAKKLALDGRSFCNDTGLVAADIGRCA